MKVKELKISPIQEDSIFSKIYAYFIFLIPFFIMGAFVIFCYYNREVIEALYTIIITNKVFSIIWAVLWFGGMINMLRQAFCHLFVEEVCSVENKTFYYQKFRKIFGIKKLMKNLEIPIVEISEVKEVKKPSFLYAFLNPLGHRNAVEIETIDGKIYKIMNSVVLKNRNSLNPTSSETNERANKIYNEVKNMILK